MLGWRHGHTSPRGGLFFWDCSLPSEETFLISCLGKKMQVFWGEGGDSFGISINPFLFGSSYVCSLLCPVFSSLEYSFSISVEEKLTFSHQSWTACTYLQAFYVWESGGGTTLHILRLWSCFFTLCFPAIYLILPRSEPFPGSLGVNSVSSHQCLPEVIASSTLINQILLPSIGSSVSKNVLKYYLHCCPLFCVLFPCGFKPFKLFCYNFIRGEDKCI